MVTTKPRAKAAFGFGIRSADEHRHESEGKRPLITLTRSEDLRCAVRGRIGPVVSRLYIKERLDGPSQAHAKAMTRTVDNDRYRIRYGG